MKIIPVVFILFFCRSTITGLNYTYSDDECGVQPPLFKIFNGDVTAIDEFPWMALLEYRDVHGKAGVFGCSGTLLTKRHVITSAHCVKIHVERELQPVRLGEYDTSSDIDCVEMFGFKDCADPAQDILIEKWAVHPKYNKHNHDIAIIKLEKDVKFTDFVRAICLPSPLDTEEVGQMLTAAGWGRTENGNSEQLLQINTTFISESASTFKRKVNVPIVPFSSCFELYQRSNTILNISQHICAGSVAGTDTCTGDSGGPLMTSRGIDGKWKIIGIISTGNSCGLKGWPAVHIRVLYYKKWILEQLDS